MVVVKSSSEDLGSNKGLRVCQSASRILIVLACSLQTLLYASIYVCMYRQHTEIQGAGARLVSYQLVEATCQCHCYSTGCTRGHVLYHSPDTARDTQFLLTIFSVSPKGSKVITYIVLLHMHLVAQLYPEIPRRL